MSFYNLIHGVDPLAGVLMAMLGAQPAGIPRFRDCWFDGEHIVIHTRTGGGNRDYYESEESCLENYPDRFEDGEEAPSGPWNEDVRSLPGFVRDEDDDYDSTYANFFFTVPERFAPLLDKLRSMAKKETQGERWEAAIERVRTAAPDDPLVARVTESIGPLFAAIEKATGAQP